MAMGKRKWQTELWISSTNVADGPGQPCCGKLNTLLAERGFDDFAEGLCAKITKTKDDRPQLGQKVGYAVNLDTEAAVAVTIQPGGRDAVYVNHRRIHGQPGRALLQKRAEKVERPSGSRCPPTASLPVTPFAVKAHK